MNNDGLLCSCNYSVLNHETFHIHLYRIYLSTTSILIQSPEYYVLLYSFFSISSSVRPPHQGFDIGFIFTYGFQLLGQDDLNIQTVQHSPTMFVKRRSNTVLPNMATGVFRSEER